MWHFLNVFFVCCCFQKEEHVLSSIDAYRVISVLLWIIFAMDTNSALKEMMKDSVTLGTYLFYEV